MTGPRIKPGSSVLKADALPLNHRDGRNGEDDRIRNKEKASTDIQRGGRRRTPVNDKVKGVGHQHGD